MPRKVLIFGANGLLGQNLVKVFHSDYEILASSNEPEPYFSMPEVSYEQCDITRRDDVKGLIREFVPNHIINAAAYTDVDGSEAQRELCWNLNATAVGHLAQAAAQVGARLVHLSTDYVFDGKSGPYTEESRPSPLGYYGRSKLAGENALISSAANHAIGRTMVLYGSGARVRPNFVTWLIKELREGRKVRIVTDQWGNPTLASELAAALRTLAESGKNGIYHLSGAEIIDRYHFSLHIAQVFDLEVSQIAAITTADLGQQAVRPTNSGFDISKAVKELGVTMSNAVVGLQKFKEELQQNDNES